MAEETEVSKHYARGNLTDAIVGALAAVGKTKDSITVNDLARVDEFLIGGRGACEDFLGQLGFSSKTHVPKEHVLDVGCGLGGAARFVASRRYGNRVTGVNLTGEYVASGNALYKWTGSDQGLSLRHGSALAMSLGDGQFDGAYILHVGMNSA